MTRRARKPDLPGPYHETEFKLAEWAERKGIEKRQLGLRQKPVDRAP